MRSLVFVLLIGAACHQVSLNSGYHSWRLLVNENWLCLLLTATSPAWRCVWASTTSAEQAAPSPVRADCGSAQQLCPRWHHVQSLWMGQHLSSSANGDKLQCLDIPILSFSDCNNAYPGMIDRCHVCAGYLEGGKDSCQGDSGRPRRVHGELQGCCVLGLTDVLKYVSVSDAKVCLFNDWLSPPWPATK
ncbi:unnamed protein product [Pleuronectes platessa]|uniref:trypsin n=1 Tax=Pleuronectes platessa TaxID=8262 RepID=A0A9N7UY70_PLEPL|nr:unnamed protein product [Pleuronectes platessa]